MPVVGKGVSLCGVGGILRAGVLPQNLEKSSAPLAENLLHCLGVANFQFLPGSAVCEAACRLRDTVGVRHIGLDVIDGRAVHKVCALNVDYRALRAVEIDAFYLYCREPYGIRTIW